jgi:hypothetical protein
MEELLPKGIIFLRGKLKVKAPMQCSPIPMINVSWRQGEVLRTGEAKAMGNGLFYSSAYVT